MGKDRKSTAKVEGSGPTDPDKDELHPSVPLWNTRHELFCQGIIKGLSAVSAYQEAFICSLESAEANAYKAMAFNGVSARIQWMKEEASKKAMLSLEEIHKFLADIVRTPVGEVGKLSYLCQEYEDTPEKTKVKMPGKLDAATLFLKVDGLLTERHEHMIDEKATIPKSERSKILAAARAKR